MRAGAEGCKYAFHAAAKVEDWGDPADFERINVEGTNRVLRATRAAGVERFVHVGTEAALLAGDPLVNADESAPLRPDSKSLYPSSKAKAERAVRGASRDGFDTSVIRPRFVWGPGDQTVLPTIVGMVESGKFAFIGGGKHRTSTTHVDNAVEGMVLAADKAPAGRAYFVTDGEPIVFRDWITKLLATQGVEAPGKSVPKPVAGALAAGERDRLEAAPPHEQPAASDPHGVLGVRPRVHARRLRRAAGPGLCAGDHARAGPRPTCPPRLAKVVAQLVAAPLSCLKEPHTRHRHTATAGSPHERPRPSPTTNASPPHARNRIRSRRRVGRPCAGDRRRQAAHLVGQVPGALCERQGAARRHRQARGPRLHERVARRLLGEARRQARQAHDRGQARELAPPDREGAGRTRCRAASTSAPAAACARTPPAPCGSCPHRRTTPRRPRRARRSTAPACGSGSCPRPRAATRPRSRRARSATTSRPSSSRAATAPATGTSSARSWSPTSRRAACACARGSTSTARTRPARQPSPRRPRQRAPSAS